MNIKCNDYLRSDQAPQNLTLLFIYYAIRTHKTHTIQEKIYTNKSYKILNYHIIYVRAYC